MKTKIMGIALFASTVAGIAFYPAYQSIGAINTPQGQVLPIELPPVDPQTQQRPLVEVVFVLDTTGSMGGLIQAAKEKIWSIATTMAGAQPAPEIRMGLVAYRDRGDDYVTRVVDLSSDLDSMYAALMDFQAAGGGDGPESVNQALHDAVHGVSWSQTSGAYRVVFLVGDAPPHMDYRDDVKYPDTLAQARQRGILVNAIQCGSNGQTGEQWKRIARLGQGQYFQVGQTGSAVAIASPFDAELARLSEELDETRLFYGTAEQKRVQERKQAATDKLHALSSPASRARRAAFNSSSAGRDNLLGERELVDDVASGRVDLATVKPEELPQSLQVLAPEERQELIDGKAERREQLQQQIRDLSDRRSRYLRDRLEAAGGAEESLDYKIFGAVKEQAGKKGLVYEADALDY